MRLAFAAGGALLFALLTWLLLSGINTNASAYAETQRAFDDFALAEASIGRDVLQARAGLLGNYDILAEAEEAMESAASRIRLHVEGKNLDPKPVEALAAAIGQYEDLVERFKTGNSLLQNSLSYVGQLSTDPAFGALGNQFAPSATALAAAVLRLAGDSSPESAKSLQQHIDRFEAQAPTAGLEGEAARALLAHARLLSNLLPEVDRTLRALVPAPSRQPFEETREVVARAQAAFEMTAQQFRALLYAVSLGLLFIALRLGQRLWTRTLRIRRLVDANIIGIFIWDINDRLIEANDALLRMVDYDREDLVSGRLRFTELTPPELRERDERAVAELRSTGTFQPFEKEYFRKDGSRMPVLIGGALFEKSGSEGVAFVLDLTQRKRAEQAVRESEYKLRQIVETVPSLLWSLAPDGAPTHFSQRLLDYFGRPFDDFKHSGWGAFVHPDDRPETEKAFSHGIQTGASYESLHRLRRAADGEYRWHHARAEPLRDQEGRIVQWYGLSVDIDEAKKAEDRLRRSEAYLAEAQRLSHTGTWVLNPTTMQYLYWSDENYRIWGFDPLQGLPSREALWQRIHDRDRVWENVLEAFRQKKEYSGEFKIVLPDGTVKYLAATFDHLFSTNGQIVEVIGTNVDVTERKRAEEALRESEYKLRQIVETVPGLLWSLAPDGEPTHFNQRLLDYFGKPFEDFKHAGWGAFVHPDDLPETAKALSHAVQTGTYFQVVHRLRRAADGEYRWHHARGEPLRDRQGNIIQWYGLSVDVDEAKKAEDRLRRSEANLAEAQRLSHTGSWVLSPATTKILDWSEECYRIWGFDPAQGLPDRETVWRRIHPGDRDRMYKETQEALRQKRDYKVDFRIVLPDGTVKYLEAIGHHLFSEHGELFQVVGTNVDVTERKCAEQALRESEAKIRRLVDANIIGIFIWDFDGPILEANEAFLHMLGYDHEDLVAGHIRWTDLTPPEWRDRDARLVQEHRMTGRLQPFEKEYFRKDGSRVPVLIGVATFEEGGNQGVAFVLDLTERNRAEQALRRSEAHLAEAQRLSHSGVSSYNETGILYGSEETYRIWGFDPAQGVPSFEAVRQRVHPGDRDRHDAAIQRALNENRGYSIAYRIVLPDGTVKHLESIGQPVLSASGALVEVIATQIDVTERKRAEEALRGSEQALRRSEDWLAQAQRLSRTGNWVFDPTTMRYLYWSDESYRIWGFDSQQGLPSRDNVWQRIHPDDRAGMWETVKQALRQQRGFVAEFRIVLPDGTVKYLEATTHHEFSLLGAPVEAVSTHVDVTERKRAQEEHERLRQLESDLAHTNRLSVMGELTASLAHEIAQPIATARNNARAATHFLDRGPPELGQVREALACVVEDADRAGDILDRIRDHIKKAPPRMERVDLNKAINDVIMLAQGEIIKNQISVQTRLTEGLSHVQADCVQMQQVVLNLILNAVEAMSSVEAGQRELLISTEQNPTGDVLVAVRDSGPGIDPDHLKRIFEALYTTKSSGMGMGLSICRSIIDAHAGRLWADVNEPRGAVFQFTLPGAEKELMTSRPAAHQTGAPNGGTVPDALR
jgi:PAS domain S-box-containing protein